jgi:hypothetical protein
VWAETVEEDEEAVCVVVPMAFVDLGLLLLDLVVALFLPFLQLFVGF